MVQEGEGPQRKPYEPVGPPPAMDANGRFLPPPVDEDEGVITEVVTVTNSAIGMIIGKVSASAALPCAALLVRAPTAKRYSRCRAGSKYGSYRFGPER